MTYRSFSLTKRENIYRYMLQMWFLKSLMAALSTNVTTVFFNNCKFSIETLVKINISWLSVKSSDFPDQKEKKVPDFSLTLEEKKKSWTFFIIVGTLYKYGVASDVTENKYSLPISSQPNWSDIWWKVELYYMLLFQIIPNHNWNKYTYHTIHHKWNKFWFHHVTYFTRLNIRHNCCKFIEKWWCCNSKKLSLLSWVMLLEFLCVFARCNSKKFDFIALTFCWWILWISSSPYKRQIVAAK